VIGLDLPGSPATFDLTGTPLAGGRVVAARRLIRSGYTSAFTGAGVRLLRDHGATAVMDLRSPRETAKLPQSLGSAHGFAYHSVTIGGDAVRPEPATMSSLADLYRLLVRGHGPALWTAVAQAIRARDGALLVHCQTGRDRTGLVLALVLRVAGTPDDVIVRAHRQVEEALRGPLVERRAAWVAKGRDGGYFDALNRNAPQALRSALDWIDAHHGDTVAYLRAYGAPTDIAQQAVDSLAARG
jgi:protein-tyrosine phosphatase